MMMDQNVVKEEEQDNNNNDKDLHLHNKRMRIYHNTFGIPIPIHQTNVVVVVIPNPFHHPKLQNPPFGQTSKHSKPISKNKWNFDICH